MSNNTVSGKKNSRLLCLIYSAVCLALALTLPFLTGQIQQIGQMLLPMHLPVLLCGFVCGWPWGLAVGFIAPLLRFVLFAMPPIFPIGLGMAFELAAYGALAGILYRLLPKKVPYIYVSLVGAMLGGRVIWGLARLVFTGLADTAFPFSAFIAGAFVQAWPGIVLQLLLLPLLVLALKKARVIAD